MPHSFIQRYGLVLTQEGDWKPARVENGYSHRYPEEAKTIYKKSKKMVLDDSVPMRVRSGKRWFSFYLRLQVSKSKKAVLISEIRRGDGSLASLEEALSTLIWSEKDLVDHLEKWMAKREEKLWVSGDAESSEVFAEILRNWPPIVGVVE